MRIWRSVRTTAIALGVALPLALAQPAAAAPPDAYVSFIDVTGAGTATVYSYVDPLGTNATAYLEYGPAASNFCTSLGVDPGGKLTTPPQSVEPEEDEYVSVTTGLSGLTPGGAYCVQVVASNGVDPATVSFFGTFTSGLPDAFTDYARSTTADTIKVFGLVETNNQATTVHVRYDTEASEFCQNNGQDGSPTTSGVTANVGPATDEVEVELTIPGLTPGAKLCVQMFATNGSGSSPQTGESRIVVGAPALLDEYVQGTSPTSTRVFAEVWTAAQTTTLTVEYAENQPIQSDFCANDGDSGAHITTPGVVVAGAADVQTAFTTLSGLDPTKGYCFRFVADNASTEPQAFFVTPFLAGGPEVSTLPATGIGPYAATLNGTVNPGGSTTSAYFEISPSSSPFCQNGGVGFADDGTVEVAAGGGTQTVPVSAAAAGLLPLAGYCYRTVASNSRATTYATPLSFSTPAVPGTPPGGGGTPGGGTPDGGTPGGGSPAGIVTQPTAPPKPGPFDTLGAAKLQYDLKMRTIRFVASVGESGSAVFARVLYKGKVVGQLRRVAEPGPLSGSITLNAATRKKLKKKKLVKFQLVVTVTAPGVKGITKKATISLKRAKDPCLVKKSSASGVAHAAC